MFVYNITECRCSSVRNVCVRDTQTLHEHGVVSSDSSWGRRGVMTPLSGRHERVLNGLQVGVGLRAPLPTKRKFSVFIVPYTSHIQTQNTSDNSSCTSGVVVWVVTRLAGPPHNLVHTLPLPAPKASSLRMLLLLLGAKLG